ncbi:hypothetical protein vBPFY1MI_142 [Pseudomonas phage vB_PF_Y1-MI]|nr:hypothetical protein vBPFY1MI_142 [Pseudomonas phage vB_PF_Y1-MI]
MSVFKIGDKVMLKETSGWVTVRSMNPCSANPINMIGEVIDPNRHHELDVEVRWSNGMVNQYNQRDLLLQEDQPPTKKEPKLSYKKYKDAYEDYFKVDTKYSSDFVSFEPMRDENGEGSQDVIISAEGVKRLRKQLKNWLDANGHND